MIWANFAYLHIGAAFIAVDHKGKIHHYLLIVTRLSFTKQVSEINAMTFSFPRLCVRAIESNLVLNAGGSQKHVKMSTCAIEKFTFGMGDNDERLPHFSDGIYWFSHRHILESGPHLATK